MAQLMSNMNTAVFKLPLGMIRIIEFPMAILAFATTSGYSGEGNINANCGGKIATAPIKFGYSFDMSDVKVAQDICTGGGVISAFTEGFVSQAQFFVFTGVISFLYILAIIALYLLFWHLYENDARFPIIDFAVTAVLSLFWFAGSCAWASGVSGVKTVSGSDSMNKLMDTLSPCNKANSTYNPCTLHESWNYASLNVSLIAGFACCGLWIANLWFIYKETNWFKARAAAAGGAGAPQPGMTPNLGSPTSQPGYPPSQSAYR